MMETGNITPLCVSYPGKADPIQRMVYLVSRRCMLLTFLTVVSSLRSSDVIGMVHNLSSQASFGEGLLVSGSLYLYLGKIGTVRR